MFAEPWGPPAATLCDPRSHRDLVPGWSCEVPGCDCGSTPSLFDARVPGSDRTLGEVLAVGGGPALLARYDGEAADGFAQDLREELRHIYEVAALDREAEALAREARALREAWWLRALRWLGARYPVTDATRAL